ncbi:MAG: hypothetical protein PHF29_02120 [Candidatus Riflebacteria bacterium]|nr:hypothetical protein [Candidatus Riflebacteria bacterium]
MNKFNNRHKKNNDKHNLIVAIISFAFIIFYGCSSSNVAQQSNSNPSKAMISFKAIDENNKPILNFVASANAETEKNARNGCINFEMEPGTTNFTIKSSQRLPKHFSLQLLPNSTQTIEVQLPIIQNIGTKYQVNKSLPTTIGQSPQTSNKTITLHFPENSLPKDANAVICQIDQTDHNRFFSTRPGNFYADFNGENKLTYSLSPVFFQITDIEGNAISKLNSPASISFKIDLPVDANNLFVCSYNDKTAKWENPIPAKFDPETNLFSAQITHFSWYDLIQIIPANEVSQVKIIVADFPSELPTELPPTEANSNPSEQLLALYAQYYKDIQNGIFKTEQERITKMLEIEEIARQIATEDNTPNIATQSESLNDKPEYQITDLPSYSVAKNLVPNAIIEFNVIKKGYAVRRETLLTDQNGTAIILTQTDASYFFIKVKHRISDIQAKIANPEIMSLEDATKIGTIYVNLANYPLITLKNGDYSGTI